MATKRIPTPQASVRFVAAPLIRVWCRGCMVPSDGSGLGSIPSTLTQRRSIPTAEESGLDPVQSGFESLGRYSIGP